jgi:ferredoxin--NADP+ reductase
MGELAGADVIVDPADLEGAEPHDTNSERNLAVLREFAAREPEGKARRVVFRFFWSPVAILGEERVEAIELVRNELDANQRAVATDRHETLPCGLVFRSVGYHGVALPGIPFDERSGTIPNEAGRVAPGVFVAGWIKRGPTGVIGTNKPDAAETVECMFEDLAAGSVLEPAHPEAAAAEALVRQRQPSYFSYADWQKLDAIEVERGRAEGRPRVKFTRIEDMLAALGR